jgi:hypothetical protein
MYKILIAYEHYTREYRTCEKLKAKFESDRQYHVDIMSLHFQSYEMSINHKNLPYNLIIVPYAYKKRSLNYLSKILNSENKPIIINLHHEQIGGEFNEFRLFPQDELTKNYVFHFVWSESFRKKLILSGVNKENIFITGNLRLDNMFNVTYSRKQIAEKYNLDENKTWILLPEAATVVLNNKEIKRRVEIGYKHNDLILMNKAILDANRVVIQEIENLDNHFFEKFELIYRQHPGTKSLKVRNEFILNNSEFEIMQWIKVVDICISRLSTSLYESDLVGIKTLKYNPTNFPKRFTAYGLDRYTAINKLSDLINLYSKLDYKKDIYKDYIGVVDSSIYEKILKICDNLLRHSYELNYVSYFSILDCKTYWLKKFFSVNFIKLIYKYDLRFLFTFSKSLQLMHDDIPKEWKKNNDERR